MVALAVGLIASIKLLQISRLRRSDSKTALIHTNSQSSHFLICALMRQLKAIVKVKI